MADTLAAITAQSFADPMRNTHDATATSSPWAERTIARPNAYNQMTSEAPNSVRLITVAVPSIAWRPSVSSTTSKGPALAKSSLR